MAQSYMIVQLVQLMSYSFRAHDDDARMEEKVATELYKLYCCIRQYLAHSIKCRYFIHSTEVRFLSAIPNFLWYDWLVSTVRDWREGLPLEQRPRFFRSFDVPGSGEARSHGRNPGPRDWHYAVLRSGARDGLRRARYAVRTFPSWALDGTCGVVLRRGRLVCGRSAGWKTDHEGEGACRRHDTERREAEVAWLMAHRFAVELNVTPWDALLQVVRIAAGKVAYTQWVLSHATEGPAGDLQLSGRRPRELTEERELADEDGNVRKQRVGTGILVHPDTGEPLGEGHDALRDLSWWNTKNEYWVDRLARYAKAAVDAGVAERLVQGVELQAQALARPLQAVIAAVEEDVDLDEDARERVASRLRGIIREELLALDREAHVTIEGHAEILEAAQGASWPPAEG